MRNIRTIAGYEMLRMLRSRSLVLNLFLLPVLLIFILGTSLSTVVGSPDEIRMETVRVGVLYEKEGDTSAWIEDFLASPEVGKWARIERPASRETAESRLRSGEYGFAVVIPAGFDQAVQQGLETKMEYILGSDEMQNTTAGLLFDGFAGHVNYLQAAASVQTGAAQVPPAQLPQQELIVKGQLGENKGYNATQYYAASMLGMFLLYSGQMVVSSLASERDGKTLQRLQSLPITRNEMFLGKMAGTGSATVLQAFFIIAASSWLMGVDWGDRPLVLALYCLLLIFICMSLSIMLTLLCKKEGIANSIISLSAVVMTFLGGGMLPLPESMLHSVGVVSLNYWTMQGMLNMMLNMQLSVLLPGLGVLSAVAALSGAAALLSYRKAGYHA